VEDAAPPQPLGELPQLADDPRADELLVRVGVLDTDGDLLEHRVPIMSAA
jgi:hypothetical protein